MVKGITYTGTNGMPVRDFFLTWNKMENLPREQPRVTV